jgi:hypothetical protein
VQLAVMCAGERDREFVARLATERARLRISDDAGRKACGRISGTAAWLWRADAHGCGSAEARRSRATRIKQYHKENRALRTETTINNTYDFDIGKRLRNLPQLRVGQPPVARSRTVEP